MWGRARLSHFGSGMVLGAVLAACASSLPEPIQLGSLPTSAHSEPPVEIYSRIARSALTCWFGVQGSLKKSHIFHADVAPKSLGGGAEIIIHERDPAADNPRSFRAYQILIQPAASGSVVSAQNLRMPGEIAPEMTADVMRWAKGQAKCGLVGIGGWAQKSNVPAIETGTLQKKKAR